MTGHVELTDLAARLMVPPGNVEAIAEAASFVFIARPNGTRWPRIADAARILRAIDPDDPRWDRRRDERLHRWEVDQRRN
jgi:hypothetical protein